MRISNACAAVRVEGRNLTRRENANAGIALAPFCCVVCATGEWNL